MVMDAGFRSRLDGEEATPDRGHNSAVSRNCGAPFGSWCLRRFSVELRGRNNSNGLISVHGNTLRVRHVSPHTISGRRVIRRPERLRPEDWGETNPGVGSDRRGEGTKGCHSGKVRYSSFNDDHVVHKQCSGGASPALHRDCRLWLGFARMCVRAARTKATRSYRFGEIGLFSVEVISPRFLRRRQATSLELYCLSQSSFERAAFNDRTSWAMTVVEIIMARRLAVRLVLTILLQIVSWNDPQGVGGPFLFLRSRK
jgi:hypothetical protein